MPRANRRRPEPGPPGGRRTGPVVEEVAFAGQTWGVRHVRGSAGDRSYRCPGCDQLVAGSSGHVVAWPQDGLAGLENRRHWHTTCWQARERRRPPGAWA